MVFTPSLTLPHRGGGNWWGDWLALPTLPHRGGGNWWGDWLALTPALSPKGRGRDVVGN